MKSKDDKEEKDNDEEEEKMEDEDEECNDPIKNIKAFKKLVI
jgi:hypothetical protein